MYFFGKILASILYIGGLLQTSSAEWATVCKKLKLYRKCIGGKQAENFQGLEINFGKLHLVYFMRPPDPKDEAPSTLKPLGKFAPSSSSRWPWGSSESFYFLSFLLLSWKIVK